MSVHAPWRPSRWTLRTKLVAWMLLLFVAVTVAVGALSVWQLSRTLSGQMDNELLQSAARFNGQYSDTIGGPPPVAGESVRVTLLTSNGQLAPLAVRFRDGTTGVETDNNVYGFKSSRTLSAKQVSILQNAGVGTAPKTVELGGYLGQYRVIAVHSETGVVVNTTLRNAGVTTIIGLPMGPNHSTVVKTTIAISLLSGAGVILVALAATYIIRRNLEPLRRVAATATRVAKLPLAEGDVVMHERVEPRDTDARTEVGQVGAALNDMLDHIDSALTARQASETQVRQFVADASHELRTPLASIRGYAELSRRETAPVPEGVTHALSRIESESDRMTTLVEDMLLLARLDAGRKLDFQPVELPIVAIETVSDARAAGPDHLWALDLPEEGVEIEGDEARIRQILINLLGNARKHTPPGSQVTVSLRPDGNGVLLQVRDNGPGISPDLLPRIFERFTRGDAARTRTEGSTGLGLSIVSAVVAAHHGRVGVASRPGETVFSIWLPRQQPRTGPAPTEAPNNPRVTV